MKGTITFEDIYGAGSLDTVPAYVSGETQQKTNPSNSDVTGAPAPGKASIINMRGNLFGQPLIVWLGLIGLLAVVKIVMEKAD